MATLDACAVRVTRQQGKEWLRAWLSRQRYEVEIITEAPNDVERQVRNDAERHAYDRPYPQAELNLARSHLVAGPVGIDPASCWDKHRPRGPETLHILGKHKPAETPPGGLGRFRPRKVTDPEPTKVSSMSSYDDSGRR